MRNPKIRGYSYRYRDGENYVRIVAEIQAADVQALDEWGIRTGMPNRTAAIRKIIKDTLIKKASGANQSNPDASNN